MTTAYSFAKRYFTSWVSKTALALLMLGFVAAWISANTGDTKTGQWWTAYLQNLSGGFIGIAATVWLVNFLIELQSHRLSLELHASAEIAALSSLRQFIRRLKQWLPQVDAPEGLHWPQLEWMHNQIDHTRTLCDALIPGANDPELEPLLTAFKSRQLDWSDAFISLAHLIHATAPAKERTAAYTVVRSRTDDLHDSARELTEALSERHEHQKLVLKIPRD